MSKLVAIMSLDGYVADPNDGVAAREDVTRLYVL